MESVKNIWSLLIFVLITITTSKNVSKTKAKFVLLDSRKNWIGRQWPKPRVCRSNQGSILPSHSVGLVKVELRGRSFAAGRGAAGRDVALQPAPVETKWGEVNRVVRIFNLNNNDNQVRTRQERTKTNQKRNGNENFQLILNRGSNRYL